MVVRCEMLGVRFGRWWVVAGPVVWLVVGGG